MTNEIMDIKKDTPYRRWRAEIESAEKESEKFQKRGREVNRKYLDERDSMSTQNKWFNVYYANVGIMQAALYAQLPKPDVERRFKDYNDDVARVAALIIQRSITQDLDDPRDTLDYTIRQCVQDRLVPGLGMAWLRLETDTTDIEETPTEGVPPQPDMETEEVGEVDDQDNPLQRITDQRVVVDYIFWEDFIWSPCRVWDERRWVGRKVYMDRDELVERWPEKGKLVPLDFKPDKFGTNTMTPKFDDTKKAIVYEIWERSTRKVVWLVKGMDSLLEEADDPLGLVGFEPCPRPMLANISTSNTMPRPDYYMIQDQYTELDNINNRISMLITACKVVGVYDRSATGVQRMLQEGSDNTLIPVDNWAMFAEKNGLKGQIDWLPLDSVIQALTQLNLARDVIKAQIYEITGISDIVRGATKASETLGAQEIKSKFAGIRIKTLQDEVARFVGDIMRIKAELQIKHFAPEILIRKSNIMATGNDEYVGPALELLQNEESFEWRITVTADSLAQADYESEKADKNEFLNSFTGFVTKVLPMALERPQMAPLVAGIMKWSMAGYRGTKDIEGMLDKEMDTLSRPQPPQPPPPPPPEVQKAQAEMQLMQAKGQQDAQKMQADLQMAQQKGQLDAQIAQQKAQMDMQIAQQKAQMEERAMQMDLAMKQKQMEMDLQMKQMEMQMKQRELEMKLHMDQMKMNMDIRANEQKMVMTQQATAMNMHAQSQQHQQTLEQNDQAHEQQLEQSDSAAEMKNEQMKSAAKTQASVKPKAGK